MTAKEKAVVLYNLMSCYDTFDIPDEMHETEIRALETELKHIGSRLNFVLSRICEEHEELLKSGYYQA